MTTTTNNTTTTNTSTKYWPANNYLREQTTSWHLVTIFNQTKILRRREEEKEREKKNQLERLWQLDGRSYLVSLIRLENFVSPMRLDVAFLTPRVKAAHETISHFGSSLIKRVWDTHERVRTWEGQRIWDGSIVGCRPSIGWSSIGASNETIKIKWLQLGPLIQLKCHTTTLAGPAWFAPPSTLHTLARIKTREPN